MTPINRSWARPTGPSIPASRISATWSCRRSATLEGGVGSTLKLRNLGIAAQTSKSFTYDATAPCTPGTYNGYAINAKQSNDYKGTGNDFILTLATSDRDVAVTGYCTFAFAFAGNAEPADSQINTNITTETYDPTGDPIKVVLLDGTGGAIASSVEATVTLTIGNNAGCAIVPPCGTLSGDRTEATVNGVATFARDPDSNTALKIDVSGVDYTLHAAGDVAGSVSGDSPPFNVQDVGKICTGGPCMGLTNGKQFNAVYQLDATAQAGDLLTVGVTTSVITCTALGFTPHTDTITTAFTGSGTKTLTMTFTNTNNEPKSSFRVCYSQPDLPGTWVDRFGATKSGADESYLQDCSKTSPANTPPCVVSVDNDKKKIIIKVLAAGRRSQGPRLTPSIGAESIGAASSDPGPSVCARLPATPG